ncbi:hypothetical protein AB0395_19495 [Streptosporangium sp. NPDC051023]|uniref:hypothetical protein n=1 Tax=Streptosporangium sp. NPDC051023 TaxID=3155410 RepID=UPI00344E4242
MATPVYASKPLIVNWTLNQLALNANPDFLAGGHLLATATSRIDGLWEQRQAVLILPSESRTDLPSYTGTPKPIVVPDLKGQVDAPRDGSATIVPEKIAVDFIPSQRLVNSADIPDPTHSLHRVLYSPSNDWKSIEKSVVNSVEQAYGNEIQEASKKNSTAAVEFIGTGIEYIGERTIGLGEVGVSLTPDPIFNSDVITDKVEPFKKDGVPVPTPSPTSTEAPKLYVKETLWRSPSSLGYGKHVLKLTNNEDKPMRVDAFRVLSSTVTHDVPSPYRVDCQLATGAPVPPVKVTVEKLPTSTPTTPTPTPTPTRTPTVTPSTVYTTVPPGTSTTTATPKPTLTVTATVTPTRPTPTAPQVVVTPTGGAQTGEAPDEKSSSGMGLIGGGTAMVLGSVIGGVALKRRRAAHARGHE